MEFDQYYVVLLRKGPTWAPGSSPELEALQKKHLAHMDEMYRAGKLLVGGPVQVPENSDLRGMDIFRYDAFESIEELKALVEQDPAFIAGRLAADYLTWYVPSGSPIG